LPKGAYNLDALDNMDDAAAFGGIAPKPKGTAKPPARLAAKKQEQEEEKVQPPDQEMDDGGFGNPPPLPKRPAAPKKPA
jgi:hypothetical protein